MHPGKTEDIAVSTPPVPLTLEGSCVLHQMFKVKWAQWSAHGPGEHEAIAAEAVEALAGMEKGGASGSAVYSLLGHKGDLLILHFRKSFDELNEAELRLRSLRISEYLEETTSYLSVVELGLYESSAKTYATLTERGLKPGTEEWNAGVEDVLARQRQAMAPRLWPEIPGNRYLCFYPMDRRRGEEPRHDVPPHRDRWRGLHRSGQAGQDRLAVEGPRTDEHRHPDHHAFQHRQTPALPRQTSAG